MRIRNSATTATLASWNAAWSGVKVAVFGVSERGFAAADTLAELGAEVLVLAPEPGGERERLLAVIGATFKQLQSTEIAPQLAAFAPKLVVVADSEQPGATEVLRAAQNSQVPVWSDIELAWHVGDKFGVAAQWICVSGQQDVAATVELTARMLLAAGRRVAPVGLSAPPVLDAVRDPARFEFFVVGLSGADLRLLDGIHPVASALLSVDAAAGAGGSAGAGDDAGAEDSTGVTSAAPATELEPYGNVYTNTKLACIYNRHSLATEKLLAAADVAEGCRAVSFGLDTPPLAGLGLVEDVLADRGYHAERRNSALELATLSELASRNLATPQDVANFLAAAALARACEVSPAAIAAALTQLPEV